MLFLLIQFTYKPKSDHWDACQRTESGVFFLFQENGIYLTHFGVTQLASHIGGNTGGVFFGAWEGGSFRLVLPRLEADYMVHALLYLR